MLAHVYGKEGSVMILSPIVYAVCVGILIRWYGYRVWRVTAVWLVTEGALLLFTLGLIKAVIYHMMGHESMDTGRPLIVMQEAVPVFVLMTVAAVILRVVILWAMGHAHWLRHNETQPALRCREACLIVLVICVADGMTNAAVMAYRYLWNYMIEAWYS